MKRTYVLLGALLLAGGFCPTMAWGSPEPQTINQKSNTVTGTIVDEKGEPVVGASIQERGTNRGTVTDSNGHFSLSVNPNAQITISYLGYKTVTRKASASMNIALDVDQANLDEVVVVGYGQQKKANLTGAVSSVDIDKTFGSRPEQDVAKALQGAVPGLTVMSNNGDLDSTPSLSIRGLGTLSNGQNSSPLIVVDGVPTSDLNMINGNDIASISVLKDASSSAIYGSRAAFGVILITTKQGKKGDRVNVKYNGQMAWDQATYLPDFPSVPEQLEAGIRAKQRAGAQSVELFGMYFDKLLPYAEAWEKQHNGKKKGYSVMEPYQSMDDVGDYYFLNGTQPLYYADYDIQDIWFNNHAPSTEHNVSISGSSKKTTYYTSINYDYKQDLQKWNPGKRERFGVNVNLSTDVTDWLTVGTRINWMRRHYSTADPWTDIYQYLWRWGSFFIPSGIMQTEDGKQYDYRMVAMQKDCNRLVNVQDRLSLNGYIKVHFTKDLTLNADYTYVMRNVNYKASNKSIYGMNWSGTKPTYIVSLTNSDATRYNTKSNRWTANAYLDYVHTFLNDHNVHVMLGVNAEDYTSDYFYARRKQLYDESYAELNLAYGDMKNATINSSTGDRASAGYFGRINYDYKGIYLLELDGRYDGSSRFRKGDQWAFFPSFSLGYRFTEEPYWKDLHKYVSNGKLRFSYGSIGNEAIGSNMFLSTLYASQMSYLDKNGTKLNQFSMPTWVDPELTWERIVTTNLGLDLGFLNNELNVTAEWYQRLTKDMLSPGIAIPKSVGANAPYTNGGELQSRGWELSVSWHHQFGKDLRVYANASIGDSKIKVKKWNNTGAKIIGHTNETAYAYEGETWGDIWGFETDRYFTENDFDGKNADGSWKYKQGVADQTGIQTNNFVYGPGDIKYKDLNGDGKIDGGKGTLEDHGDVKVIGNCLPRYEYSFRLGASWKGIDIDAFFQGVGKRDAWKTTAFNFPTLRSADIALYANQTKYNIYDPDNGIVNISESNDYPCLYAGNDAAGNVSALSALGGCHNYYPQSKYLIHMSYLRLKSLTVGYTFPQQWMKKIYVQSLRVYFSGQNLFLLHKGSGNLPLDPEINTADSNNSNNNGGWGRTMPITRTFAFGLQVTF
jgi:TonB-linked SusC/RagA family outer membrane protein